MQWNCLPKRFLELHSQSIGGIVKKVKWHYLTKFEQIVKDSIHFLERSFNSFFKIYVETVSKNMKVDPRGWSLSYSDVLRISKYILAPLGKLNTELHVLYKVFYYPTQRDIIHPKLYLLTPPLENLVRSVKSGPRFVFAWRSFNAVYRLLICFGPEWNAHHAGKETHPFIISCFGQETSHCVLI